MPGFPWLVSHSAKLRQQANARSTWRSSVRSLSAIPALLLAPGLWTGSWQVQQTPLVVGATEPPLTEFRCAHLANRHQRLKKRGKHWDTLTKSEERHQVRIAAKKLRYAV